MTRKLRVIKSKSFYHIYSKGSRSEFIFANKEDYELFLNLMIYYANKYSIVLIAYCLMTNHYHIIIYTNKANIDRFMQVLLSVYAKKFNKKYNNTGNVFGSRYGYKEIVDDKYLFDCCNYIHLNPVKAGIVNKAEDYEWSSCKFYCGLNLDKKADILDMRRLLSFFENKKNKSSIFEKYRKYILSLSKKIFLLEDYEEFLKREVLDINNLYERRKVKKIGRNFNRRAEDKFYKNKLIAEKIIEKINKYFEDFYYKEKRIFNIMKRNYIIYILSEKTDLKYKEIGRFFNINKRETVYNTVLRLKNKIKEDKKIRELVEKLFDLIN